MNKSTLIRLLLFIGITFVSLTILLLCGVDITQKLPWGGVILAGVLFLTGILRNIYILGITKFEKVSQSINLSKPL